MIFIAIVFLVLGSVNQRSMWRATVAWQYRDPEANEPSDSAYMLGRMVAFAIAIVALLFALAQCSQDRQAAERRAAQEKSDEMLAKALQEQLREDAEDPYPYELIDAGVARELHVEPGKGYESGHVIGYRGDPADSALTVVYELSPCGHLHSAQAKEIPYLNAVTIRLIEATDGKKFAKGCPKKDRNRPVPRSTDLKLATVLGHRSVHVDNGWSVPRCAPRPDEQGPAAAVTAHRAGCARS